MDKKFTITLSESAQKWLHDCSALAGKTPKEFLNQFLADLADSEDSDDNLIDQLLTDSLSWFPPVMELEEQSEMREEILGFLCHMIFEQYSTQIGVPLTDRQISKLRNRLAERADFCWR